jgi:hypothetical protein
MASPEERRIRRQLARLGFKLLKSRRRAELSIDDRGGYAVVRRSTGRFVCSGNFSLTLEEAQAAIILARKGEFDPHPLDGPQFEFDTRAVDKLLFDAAGQPKAKFTV